MILFFDTETTGLHDFKMPPDHDCQPHLVQLGALLTDNDGEAINSVSLIVNPGAPIPRQASDVHGITDDRAKAFGVSPNVAAPLFSQLLRLADTVVAHNLKYDVAIMRTAWSRNGNAGLDAALSGKTLVCTAETAAPVVNLPPTERMKAAGFNKPKTPKLEECMSYFFNEGLDGAHDALVDVTACKRVYFKLKELGGV